MRGGKHSDPPSALGNHCTGNRTGDQKPYKDLRRRQEETGEEKLLSGPGKHKPGSGGQPIKRP